MSYIHTKVLRLTCILFSGLCCLAAEQGLMLTLNNRLSISVPNAHFFLEPGESLHPSFPGTAPLEFSGQLQITRNSSYVFDTGAAALFIDGRPITQPVALTTGQHALRIKLRSQSSLRLLWKSEIFPWEPLPDSALSHTEPALPDRLIESGRQLARELGCMNCHKSGNGIDPARPLTGAGSKLQPAWIHAYLARPAARMPQMLSGSQMADATAFLASLKSPLPQPRRPNEVDIGKGSELFGTTGCQACHEQRMQGLGSKYNLASLTAFLQSPAGAMPPMLLDEGDARALAGSLLLSREPAFERPPPNGHPEAGKQVIETSGCLACHALEGAINRFKAKPLAALNSGAGCLANSVGLPNYNLDAAQKQALDAYLVFYRANPAVHPAPIYELRNQIKLLRCNSCHEKEAAPPLNNVGAKFTIRWLDSVLTKGARLRQGHELRMPHYPGLEAAAFAKSEGLAPDDGAASPRHSGAHRETGLGLLGTNAAKQGMGCIGCHDWGQRKSLGEEGPQLINAGQRLRWDWFERWMRDPARILSGTSMPAYFRTMEPGRASDRMLSLWAAMSIGPAAPAPDGFSSESTAEAKPVPGKEAIIIRWDMPEATPAAIAVGLPGGQLSYCFDAGESRLRYIWRGGFLDLSGTLLRKTDKNKLTPTADLVGEIFYREAEFPLRTGSKEHIPQRRFRGYRIVGSVPEFHYEIDGIPVFEKIEPENGVLLRKLRINSPIPVWFQPTGQQVSPGRETTIVQGIQP